MVKNFFNQNAVIALVLVLLVVVSVVVVVRESRNSAARLGTEDVSNAQSAQVGPSEMVLEVKSPQNDQKPQEPQYLSPREVTMQDINEMIRNSNGSLTLMLKNGQKLLVYPSEIDQLNPTVKLYAEYNQRQGLPK